MKCFTVDIVSTESIIRRNPRTIGRDPRRKSGLDKLMLYCNEDFIHIAERGKSPGSPSLAQISDAACSIADMLSIFLRNLKFLYDL